MEQMDNNILHDQWDREHLWRMVKKLCFQNKNLTFAETNELR